MNIEKSEMFNICRNLDRSESIEYLLSIINILQLENLSNERDKQKPTSFATTFRG
jgi:hypothetical protein